MRDQRLVGTRPLVEPLEGRTLLSAPAQVVSQAPLAEGMALSLEAAPRRAASIATTTTLAVTPRTAVLGQRLSLVAQVKTAKASLIPSGVVQFRDGKKVLGSATLRSGKATFSVYNLFKGTHSFSGIYKGAGRFTASHKTGVIVPIKQGPMVTKAGGLKVATVQAGKGAGAAEGQLLKVNYTGYLTTGQMFDSSLLPGRQPFSFQLGAGQVIDGWDQGMVGMKAGETRVLIIPPGLAYGANPPSGIPANATLIFIVKMIEFHTPIPRLQITGPNNTVIANNQAASTDAGTDFGAVAVDSSSLTATYALENAGEGGLAFTSTPNIKLGGQEAADFVVTQPNFSSRPVTFTIRFAPKSAGAKTATITLNTNDPKNPAFTFTIAGTGT